MLDLHNYPAPEMYLYDAQRANVLGEYGGIGWVVKNHIWEPDRNWGYIQFNSSKEVTDESRCRTGTGSRRRPPSLSRAAYSSCATPGMPSTARRSALRSSA